MAEPRFWWMDLDKDNHQVLKDSIGKDELFGIVDEKDGGIIAYAIGIRHTELIVKALRSMPVKRKKK